MMEEEINTQKKKINKEKMRKILILVIAFIIVLLIVFYLLMRFYNKKNKYTFEDYSVYQYFSGVRVDYEGKVTIKSDGQISKMEAKDKKINNNTFPIYFKNEDNTVMFPINMSLIIPKVTDKTYRIIYFSKIVLDDDEKEQSAYLLNDNKKIFIDESFLFDGNDLYFFNHDVTINIDDEERQLSALSYMIVNYKGEIEIYDKKSDKYEMIESYEKTVIATLGNYKIDLASDLLIIDKNNSRLLIRNIDNLPIYKGI